ncbi:MAG: AzlC family ABC transporter permease [Hyphomicrobiales bacterium]
MGIRDAVPAILGLAPLGLAVGATAASSPVARLTGWMTAPLLYGASAQLAALAALGCGAAGASLVSTVAVINARSLFYSASLRRPYAQQPRWFRWFAPYLLVDPLFALVSAEERLAARPGDVRRYYLAAGGAIWATWLVFMAAGIALGSRMPSGGAIRYAVPALLIGLLAPALRKRAARVAAVSAAVVVFWTPTGGAAHFMAGAAGSVVGALSQRAGGRP